MIKIRDLEYLSAIEKFRHFGKAANACFVSQPTLSGQLMKLEQQLGLQLVERHRHNVMLTPAGDKLVMDARRVLKAAEDFERSAKNLLDPLAGDFHVGLIPTLAPYLLPHIMDDLTTGLPKIQFYLHEKQTKDLLLQLDEGKLDVLILPYLEEMNKFDSYHLFDEPFILVTPRTHKLASHKSVTLNDLHNQSILTLEDGHCLKDQALGYCFSAGAKENTSFQATSLETLRHMVGSGIGVTLLPALATNNKPQDNMCYIPFSDPSPIRKIALVIRPNYSRMECVRALVASIRESINDAFAT